METAPTLFKTSPFSMVIFGATGDLMRKKLLPSLFKLYKEGRFSEKFYIVGFARRPFTNDEFRIELQNALVFKNDKKKEEFKEFAENIFYQQGNFSEKDGYEDLIEVLKKFDEEIGACISRLFYLATPPQNYLEILNFLYKTKLSEGCGHKSGNWTKMIIEKPFGKDLKTSKEIENRLCEIFEERQIFRVDHYLGKETVQNMIAFRFANGIFEPVWNKNHIDHVQITWAEKKGVENRGEFFDGVGILRDVAQNHLMQLIAAVGMEQPRSFTKEDLRDARAKAIKSIKPIADFENSVVRGQYKGYKNEKNVSPNSTTETFVAFKTFLDTERFSNVPFYVRAGKGMPEDLVEISIVFIQTCHVLFKEYGCPEEGNVLKIRIQPNQGIGLRVIAKKPGPRLTLANVNMDFSYKNEFGGNGNDAYEKILLDIFAGDQMLFNRSDELESSWEFITKILDGWKEQKAEIPEYEKETWGPKEAKELIEKGGKKWII